MPKLRLRPKDGQKIKRRPALSRRSRLSLPPSMRTLVTRVFAPHAVRTRGEWECAWKRVFRKMGAGVLCTFRITVWTVCHILRPVRNFCAVSLRNFGTDGDENVSLRKSAWRVSDPDADSSTRFPDRKPLAAGRSDVR